MFLSAEYSRELSFSGSTQEYYHLREERNFTLDVEDLCKTLENGYDFLILCNPNNPTSSAVMQEDLRKLICTGHQCSNSGSSDQRIYQSYGTAWCF